MNDKNKIKKEKTTKAAPAVARSNKTQKNSDYEKGGVKSLEENEKIQIRLRNESIVNLDLNDKNSIVDLLMWIQVGYISSRAAAQIILEKFKDSKI